MISYVGLAIMKKGRFYIVNDGQVPVQYYQDIKILYSYQVSFRPLTPSTRTSYRYCLYFHLRKVIVLGSKN